MHTCADADIFCVVPLYSMRRVVVIVLDVFEVVLRLCRYFCTNKIRVDDEEHPRVLFLAVIGVQLTTFNKFLRESTHILLIYSILLFTLALRQFLKVIFTNIPFFATDCIISCISQTILSL